MLFVNGGAGYAECLDDERISWWAKFFEISAPLQKKILIDERDVAIFKKLYQKMEGKTLVAVVNHWHVPGIEAHWRNATGTEIQEEPINPIGDMDINDLMETDLVTDALNRLYAKNANSEPIGSYVYLTHYHKYCQEYERARHCDFDSYKDPKLEHSLYLGENDHVDNLPYEHAHH